MKHHFQAARELTIEGKIIPAESPIAVIETEIPLDRFVRGLTQGGMFVRQSDAPPPAAAPDSVSAKTSKK